MSFLSPENAHIHYEKLKAAAQKLPASPAVTKLKAEIESLAPFVGKGEPELEAALDSYITASQAILLNNTAQTTVEGRRRQTPISKTLSSVCAHANALLIFCEEDGDAVIDEILKEVAIVSAALKP